MSFKFQHWLRNARGATVVEYLIAVILAALVLLGASKLFGRTLYNKFVAGDEKIREMDRDKKDNRAGDGGGYSDSGVSGGASDEQGGESQFDTGGARVGKTHGDGDPGSLSASNSSFGASGRDGARGGPGAARRSGGAGVGADSDSSVSGGRRRTPIKGPKFKDYRLPGEVEEEEAGFNPFILLVVGLLFGFLIFVMIKGNKEGG